MVEGGSLGSKLSSDESSSEGWLKVKVWGLLPRVEKCGRPRPIPRFQGAARCVV